MMEKIGIFGGTFDPVHNEHIKIASAALNELKLNKLFIMPASIPPHKDREVTVAADRLMMAKLAFKDLPKTEVSSFEVIRGGSSFTVDTVEHFKRTYPKARLFLILGADMLTTFLKWKDCENIVKNCRLAAVRREGFDLGFDKALGQVEKELDSSVKVLKVKGDGVSSTMVRVLKMFGQDFSHLVPVQVKDYIFENNLYPPTSEIEYAIANLSKKRLKHSAYVALKALEKSVELKIPEGDIIKAAALHDIAKDKPTLLPVIPGGVPEKVKHQYMGEFIARTELGVRDEGVLNAIKYHSTGRAAMSEFEKLIYVSDMIEDGRDYPGVDRLRKLYKENFSKCFKECLKAVYSELKKKKGEEIYGETLNAIKYYK